MNEQHAPKGIEWTRIKNADGTVRRGFTWNPVAGCKHACEWVLPDGNVAECYAKTVADKFRSDKVYPDGFDHHYWHPERLSEPAKLKEPAGIFLDSMADVMGHWVPDEQVQAVLDVCAANSRHIFQLLTKNAPRLLQFKFPPNVWVGVSAPPSHFMGKALSLDQQKRYVSRALDVLANVRSKETTTWMSIEPLSFDIGQDAFWPWLDNSGYHNLPLDWAVIGAATNGRKVYQPKPEWVSVLLNDYLSGKPVFFKGNLRNNPAAKTWREEFPDAK